MHAASLVPPALTASTRTGIGIFGEPDAGETDPRVAVPVTLHLSFYELLGVLTFGMVLGDDELSDGGALRDALRCGLLTTNLFEIDSYAHKARAAYDGRHIDKDLCAFVARLAPAVTRVFGVAA
ncbi:hypothetical protein GCM10027168_56020 [Streptomyces capparidis]